MADAGIAGEARALRGRQIDELGGIPVSWSGIEVSEEGTTRWAAMKVTMRGPEVSHEARASSVLHLEHGDWRIVQVHWSAPKANVEVLDQPTWAVTLGLPCTCRAFGR